MPSRNLKKINAVKSGHSRREFLKTSALGLLFMDCGWNAWRHEL